MIWLSHLWEQMLCWHGRGLSLQKQQAGAGAVAVGLDSVVLHLLGATVGATVKWL